MAKEIQFSSGVTVPSGFLNDTQELLTGAIWGLYIARNADPTKLSIISDGVNRTGVTMVGNSGNYLPGYIDATIHQAASTSASAGSVGIYAYTTAAMQATTPGSFAVIASATGDPTTIGDARRKIGTANWDGSTTLSAIKLLNGVYANADQYNSFTFRTVVNDAAEIPLTLRGQTNQTSAVSKMLSVGYDVSSTYNEKLYISTLGRIVSTQSSSSDAVLLGYVGSEAYARTYLGGGSLSFGPGTAAASASIGFGGTNTVLIGNTLDVPTITNSAASSLAISVDLNLASGKKYKINGSQISTSALSDASGIAYLSGTNAFTGAQTFSASLTGTGALGLFARVGAGGGDVFLSSMVSGDSASRFSSNAIGSLSWGPGNAATDIALTRFDVGVLRAVPTGTATRAAIQVVAAPVDTTDLTNKAYVDGKLAVTVQTVRTITTGTDTPTSADSVLLVNRTGTVGITLFTAVGNAGKHVTIKDISGAAGTSTNKITISTTASQTIDGAATYTLDTNYEWVVLCSNGTNWYVVG